MSFSVLTNLIIGGFIPNPCPIRVHNLPTWMLPGSGNWGWTWVEPCLTLTQFKALLRIPPEIPDSCDKCHTSSCSLTHMFYSCPLLFCVWQNYFCTTSKMLSMTINVSAHIFWISQDLNHMTYKQLDIPAFPSSLAKRHLLLRLKLLSELSGSVISCLFLKLQKIKYSVRANSDNFNNKWQSF